MATSSEISTRRPSSPAERLRARRDTVQKRWLDRVKRDLGGARNQPEPLLLDNLPKMLDALAGVLEGRRLTEAEHSLFITHADSRIEWTDYSVDELMREYGVLRKELFSVLEEAEPLTREERDLILDFIDEGIQVGSTRYTKAQQFHERLEMQYLKLIEHLVAESGGAAASETGPERFLEVIVKDLGAEAAAFFLYGEGTVEIRLSFTAGRSKQLSELYRVALSLSGASTPSERGEAVRLVEVASLEAPARDNLRQLGIEWLVWVEILSRSRLPGALCLGFREQRAFDPVELHLLEVLGDRLALLLASIQLQQQSQSALERARRESHMLETERNSMDEERRRRDELIAAISHDLKNPLHTARLGAELIRKGPAAPGTTERLADQILSSISRSDQMVHDMLDTQRIRAGKRLPLKMELYQMSDVVNEVVEEMRRVHGDRFVVHAQRNVTGYWSRDGMRRVLENLVSNAVKYSDPGSPITISVSAQDHDRMRMSVHNHGPALSPEEQVRIFRPFERGSAAERSGKQGWGIGLTLVQGIVDGHGGTVRVESSPDGGTTFYVNNPMDSRPYQAEEGQA